MFHVEHGWDLGSVQNSGGGPGEEFFQGELDPFRPICEQDAEHAKLRQNLAAGTTGRDRHGGVRDDAAAAKAESRARKVVAWPLPHDEDRLRPRTTSLMLPPALRRPNGG